MSCLLIYELLDTGIEQEFSSMYVPTREIWESVGVRMNRSTQTCWFECFKGYRANFLFACNSFSCAILLVSSFTAA